jgi:hypothetical protein
VDYGLATVVPGRGTPLRQLHSGLPQRKIAVLWQNDQFGRDLYKGIQDGLGNLKRMIIAGIAFDIADAHIDGHVSILIGRRDSFFCGRADHCFAGDPVGGGFPLAPGVSSERCGRLDRHRIGTSRRGEFLRRDLGQLPEGSERSDME